MSKSPLRHHIRRSKHNILPSTFPGPFRNTTTLLRLPRCLHHMKHCLFYRIIYFTNSCSHHDLYNLRGLCFKTRSNISIVCFNKFRMTSWLPSTISHIRGTNLCKSKIRKEGIEPPHSNKHTREHGCRPSPETEFICVALAVLEFTL